MALSLSPARGAAAVFAAVFAAASVSLLVIGATAADTVVFLGDHAAAVAQARKQGKLLLVVHLSGDFAVAPENSPEVRLYRNLTLADSRVATALADRLVVTYRQVGEAKALPRRTDPDPNKKQPAGSADTTVSYFCLPDERVLHFVPGFLSPNELLAELNWVEAAYAQIVKKPQAEMPAALRALHREALDKDELETMSKMFSTRWPADSPPPEYSTVDLPQALAAARLVWQWSQDQRLGMRGAIAVKDKPNLPAQLIPRTARTAALASHGGLGTRFAHLVLSEFPLIHVSDLARPTFEACAGRRFWQVSQRREELAAWWAKCRTESRRTLLLVTDDVFAPQAAPAAEEVPACSADDVLRLATLWRAESQVVTIDELAQLLADAQLAPLAYDPAIGPPRFIVHDARGSCSAEVAAGEATLERLVEALRSAVESSIIESGARQATSPQTDLPQSKLPQSGVKTEGGHHAKH